MSISPLLSNLIGSLAVVVANKVIQDINLNDFKERVAYEVERLQFETQQLEVKANAWLMEHQPVIAVLLITEQERAEVRQLWADSLFGRVVGDRFQGVMPE